MIVKTDKLFCDVSTQRDSLNRLTEIIVYKGEWLWSPANIKGVNKDAKIYVGRSTTVHNLLFCPHTLCMNYITNMFLLVSSSVGSKQLLCFVHGQGQKSEQKHATKNFVGFHNHSPLLTMLKSYSRFTCTVRVRIIFSCIWIMEKKIKIKSDKFIN